MPIRRNRPIPRNRNMDLAAVAKSDPTRLRTRTAEPKAGKGRKQRPRVSNRAKRESGPPGLR